MSDLNITISVKPTSNPKALEVAGALCVGRLEVRKALREQAGIQIQTLLDDLFPRPTGTPAAE